MSNLLVLRELVPVSKERQMGGERRQALVTGASSGLGLEAAAQLAESGLDKVVVTARTAEKVSETVRELSSRTGSQSFEGVVLDNDVLASVETAAEELRALGGFDVLILNAGIAPPAKLLRTVDGFDAVASSTLIGHHLLTRKLLDNGQINDDARIVIAGSEAARGDVPMFSPLKVAGFAAENFEGDVEAAIEAQLRMTAPARYRGNDVYATTKLFAVWWSAEISKRLPKGATANAVSPGSTPDTRAMRNGTWILRKLMVPMFRLMPGMSHEIEVGAARYLEATTFDDDVSGQFFASPPGKMIGPLTSMDQEHLEDPDAQRALWKVLERVTEESSAQVR